MGDLAKLCADYAAASALADYELERIRCSKTNLAEREALFKNHSQDRDKAFAGIRAIVTGQKLWSCARCGANGSTTETVSKHPSLACPNCQDPITCS